MNKSGNELATYAGYRNVGSFMVGATVIVGVLTVTVGWAPWPFLGLYALAASWLFAPRIGWGRAFWGSIVACFFIIEWLLTVDPYVGVRLDIATMVLLAAVLIGSLVARWRPLKTDMPPKVGLIDSALIAGPAVLSALLLVGGTVLRGSRSLSWAMHGDAQFNTVLSRIVGADNGETATNVQVLSLAQGLMAIVHLPGRAFVPAAQLLIHDVTRQSDMWILMILLSSVLAGAIAQRVLARSARLIRWVGIVISAVIPLTWFMTGYAMMSGFYNVSLTFLCLELAVYFWLATRRAPLWTVVAQMALATVMLGAWTPMAVVPLAFAASASVRQLRSRPGRREWVWWAISVSQFALYAALFILPSYLSKNSVLSQNGTILPIAESTFFIVASIGVIVAAAISSRFGRAGDGDTIRDGGNQNFAIGVLLIVASALVGVMFLILQNRHIPQPWIYYPIKFAWVSIELLFVLIWIGTCLLLGQRPVQRFVAVVGLLAVGVFVVSIMQLTPPMANGVTAQLPLVSLAKNADPLEPAVRVLSPVANKRVIFSRYLDHDSDVFMNQWLFQLTVHSEFDPIRSYAYQTVDTVSQVCDAATAWGGEVTVYTRDSSRAVRLNDACGDVLRAVVRD